MGFELPHTLTPFLRAPSVDYKETYAYFPGDLLAQGFRYRATVDVTTSSAYADEFDDVRPYRLSVPRVTIDLWKYPVLKRTPKGAWIPSDDGGRRFVLDGSGKRWAHETREHALESLRIRMRRRLAILAARLEDTELALYALTNLNVEEVRHG